MLRGSQSVGELLEQDRIQMAGLGGTKHAGMFTVQFKPRQLISSNYTGALAKLTSKHENSHSALPEVIYSVGVPLNKINESLQKIFQTATF